MIEIIQNFRITSTFLLICKFCGCQSELLFENVRKMGQVFETQVEVDF